MSRYFAKKRSFANSAIDILLANEEAIEEETESLDETNETNATNVMNEPDAKAQVAPILSLNTQRMTAVYEWMNTELRHNDHRFEWTRKEFENWTKAVCEKFGYTVEIKEIGEAAEEVGASTQMGVFTKCE